MSLTLDKLSEIKFGFIKSNRMNNIQSEFNEIIRMNRKKEIELEEDTDNYQREKEIKRRRRTI